MTQTLIGGYTNPRFRDAFNAALNPDVPLDMERIFGQTQGWGGTPWTQTVGEITAGRTPIVSTKLSTNWASAATGSQNARLDVVVNELCKLNITALKGTPCLTFHHEPENDPNDGTPATYNAMYKFFAGRYLTKLRTAGWDICFIFMGGSLLGWTPWTKAQVEQSVAGTGIDRVYFDIYEKPGGSGDWATKLWMSPDDPASPFRAYYEFCVAKGYKACLPEIGVNRKQVEDGSQATFLDALSTSKLATILEGAIYYDRDVGEGGATSNTRISHLPGALRSWAKMYDSTVVVPPVPGDPCADVKTQLAAVTEELEEVTADAKRLQAELAVTTLERDQARTKIANAQAALA